MINLSNLNKLIVLFLFLTNFCNFSFATDAVDIWKKKEKKNDTTVETQEENNIENSLDEIISINRLEIL